MQCAVIDIGSNSIRLSVYDAEKTNFKILFKEKIMAGLASYVAVSYTHLDVYKRQVLTGAYVILGGYMATAINDFIQGIIMLGGICLLYTSRCV